MRFPVRGAPFFWILVASAAGHLLLLLVTQGALLFPSPRGGNGALPAGFAINPQRPTIDTAPKEEIYYRIPVTPTPLTPAGKTAAAASVPPSPITSTSPAASPPAPGPAPETPVPAAWTRTLATGKSQGPVFFGESFSGKTLVFAIDISGSMLEKSGKTTRLREAYEGVMRSLGSLEPSQRFNVLLYADRVDQFEPKPVPAEPHKVLAAYRYLDGDINCGGSTNLQDALRRAMAMEPDSILLLSDGEANSEDSAILAEVRFLQARLSRQVRIHTVGFYLQSGSKAELLLKQLALESGGTYAAWNPRKKTGP